MIGIAVESLVLAGKLKRVFKAFSFAGLGTPRHPVRLQRDFASVLNNLRFEAVIGL